MEFKTKIKRRIRALKEFFMHSKSRNAVLKKTVEQLYFQSCQKQYKIKTIPLKELIKEEVSCELFSLLPKNGNMNLQEILAICALIKHYNPQQILEIGTFNGLTTLNMALNSSSTTKIHTLDIDPAIAVETELVWDEDLKFILDTNKQNKAYANLKDQHKIHEHLGNSLTYDFKAFGNPDFIFIDGGHSYKMIANDTAKALDILSNSGVIVWHDYSCHIEGVFCFLNELQENLSLSHIEGTSLVVFCKN